MDTTAKYILMCEKAVEIQKLAPKVATRIHTKKNVYICSDYDHGLGGIFHCKDTYEAGDYDMPSILVDTESTWLPYQHNLQEMVGDDSGFRTQLDWLDEMRYACHNEIGYGLTWEQLWLQVVMKQRYSKVWSTTKKDWVG